MTTHRLAHEDVAGTHQGYSWHLRDGSLPCDPCTTAHADHMQAWRDQRNPHRPVKVPLAVLGELLAAVPDEARGGFVKQLGPIAVRAAAARRRAEHRKANVTPRNPPSAAGSGIGPALGRRGL